MDSGEIGMFGRFARAMLSAVLAIGVALPAMPQVAFADDRGSAAAVAPEEAGISLAASSQSDGTMPSPAAEGDASAAVPVIEDSTQARVGFVYIDAPALFVGGTQDVVVALDETEAVVQSAELFYVDTAGVQKSVAANKFAGNAALFEISVGEAGDYEVRSMAATLADGSVVVLDLYDEERAAYPGFIAVSAAADPFSIDDEGLEGAALTFSLDGDGGLVAGKSLPDVIGSAALQARGSSNLLSSDDGTLVIVLDAGHGGSDPGAVANGLLEKDLTLSIARYCKEALEQYANVKVYMTRSSDFYVGLKERVDYAVSVGADAFVGIHINSAGTSGANGAEVWYPNASSWYYEAHVEGQQLAESILEKLTELGLYDRGVKVRDSDDELNPDGSVADYYATIRYARQVGMPSIIVEHAFITGDGDSQKLAQDSWLKAMGEADAEGIAQAYGLSKGQWVFEDGVWHWYEGSTMVTNAWRNIDGMRHWFGPDGVAVRGWHDIDGSRYYFDPATANLYRGWLDEGGKRYRLDRDDGHLWTGWYTVDGVWYCSDGDGVLRKGWYDEGGKRYRLDRDDGHLWTGGFTVDGVWYHALPDGEVYSGWIDGSDGGRYYYDPAKGGALALGWFAVDGGRYYASPDGSLVGARRGRQALPPRPRRRAPLDGLVHRGRRVVLLGRGRRLRKGWYDEGGKRYRLDRDDGHLWTGGFTVDGVWYHALPDGEVYSGWIDGSDGGQYDPAKGGALALGWFAVDEAAATTPARTLAFRGWLDEGGKRYRLDRDDGHLWTGWYTVDGVWYCSDGDGVLRKGWYDEGGKRYRLDRDDGHLWTGWYTVDGVWYYSDENGVLNGGWQLSGIYYYYYNSNGELVPSKTQELYYVAGDRAVSPEKMVDAFQMSGAVYPSADLAKGGAPTIDDFCRILYEEATAEGIRPQVVFCQAMLETGWLRFGGDVSIGQFNFAGLGAVGGGASGASFPDVRTGIRAQVQHLKAYANSEPLVKECVDPRFSYVQRGVSEYVQWLGIPNNPQGKGWAASDGYGMNIVEMIMRYGLW